MEFSQIRHEFREILREVMVRGQTGCIIAGNGNRYNAEYIVTTVQFNWFGDWQNNKGASIVSRVGVWRTAGGGERRRPLVVMHCWYGSHLPSYVSCMERDTGRVGL